MCMRYCIKAIAGSLTSGLDAHIMKLPHGPGKKLLLMTCVLMNGDWLKKETWLQATHPQGKYSRLCVSEQPGVQHPTTPVMFGAAAMLEEHPLHWILVLITCATADSFRFCHEVPMCGCNPLQQSGGMWALEEHLASIVRKATTATSGNMLMSCNLFNFLPLLVLVCQAVALIV